VQELLAARHRDVEQPPFILDRSLVARLPDNSGARQQMPDVPAPGLLGGKAVLEQRRDEHHGPLHTLRLVHRHDADGVGVGVLVVLPALGVVVLGAILKKVGERTVLRRRLRVIVDRFEIRDQLAELPKVVEDDLTAIVRHTLFADTCFFEKVKEKTLD
jgi:hypothetical protein